MTIRCVNQAAIYVASNLAFRKPIKNVDVGYYFITKLLWSSS